MGARTLERTAMFKHILLPTDGSELAQKTITGGVAFAKSIGARITGYYALHQPAFIYNRFGNLDNQIKAELERRAREVAQKYVDEIGKAAKAAGVEFELLITIADMPAEGIIDAAKERKCDAIFLAPHGRMGVTKLILGSVTQEVLARSTLPVIVFR
jgi:nucleotide-binding universal stress UspA family protein